MLELFTSGAIGLWLDMAGIKATQVPPAELLTWQGVPVVMLPSDAEQATKATVEKYLQELSQKGRLPANQGLWMQSDSSLLIDRQGTVPLPAASLTKIATTLAALETWGPSHRFETLVSATGPINNGVLQGDLVVTGGGDPFFIWEEAIALGSALNKAGIRQVNGSLVINGDFYMNYDFDPLVAAHKLKQGLNSATWTPLITAQYLRMKKGTPRPSVAIKGGVTVVNSPYVNPNQILLVRHKSMTLTQILKEMNIYSNNEMSEMLAKSLGGAFVVSQLAAKSANVPPGEILLINGSGLGVENRISPRAATAMLRKIHNYLEPHNLTIADLFPVSGRDRRGTMLTRRIPNGTPIKTGTLNQVSALAGVMPTRDRGLVWFAIINGGDGILDFRNQQDLLLQRLLTQWGASSVPPMAITPKTDTLSISNNIGDARRNEVISGVQANLQQ